MQVLCVFITNVQQEMIEKDYVIFRISLDVQRSDELTRTINDLVNK